MTVAGEEVDEPIVDVVGYIHGSHFVEQSGMSNSIKGLAEVQRDDHYIHMLLFALLLRAASSYHRAPTPSYVLLPSLEFFSATEVF